MITSHPSVGWFSKVIVFLAMTLCSTALLRLVVRSYESVFSDPAFALPIGWCSLVVGVEVAWSALRRWRFTAPIRCAAVIGLSAGLAGAGLFLLLGYLGLHLATPSGPLR